MKNLSSTGIRFSGDSIKSCISFIDLVDSTKNTITMDSLSHIRIYYSKFINSVSKIVKRYDGKVIKNIGDCLLVYFPKTSDNQNKQAFRDTIECSLKILEDRYILNQKLSKQHLPPFNYRISMDYGLLDLALVGEFSQIDLFGSTVNVCSKINSLLSIPNEIIIGDNFYRILKSIPKIEYKYNFKINGKCKINEAFGYLTYRIEKVDKLSSIDDNNWTVNSFKKFLGSPGWLIEDKNEKRVSFLKRNKKIRQIILVDDEKDILFTYRSFLNNIDYEIISFTEGTIALNHIKNLSNFSIKNSLVILDIRMKNMNGFQLHQQIKAIDPAIKILFITALDILDELLTIVPGISKEQILRKPIDRNLFIQAVRNMLK